MKESNKGYAITDLILSVIVVLALVLLFTTALGLPGRSGQFPRVIAGSALIFAMLDVAVRARRLMEFDPENPSNPVEMRLSELGAMAWPILLLGLVYVFGFTIAAPVFMALFFVTRRTVSLFTGIAVIAGFAGISYLIFTALLGVRLYGGVLGLNPW